jgi:two-component system, NarL family, nitrate/nitrite response regulator NarL
VRSSRDTRGAANMHILFAGPAGLFREGVARLLGDLVPCAEVRFADYAASGSEVRLAADLLVLDGDHVSEALETVGAARRSTAALPIVVLLTTLDPRIVESLITAGAAGCVDKSDSADVLRGALRLVLAGGMYLPPALFSFVVNGHEPSADTSMRSNAVPQDSACALTPRQIEVLALAARGDSNKSIARQLNIAEGTVKVHLYSVYKALKVGSRSQASIAAMRLNKVSDEQLHKALSGQLSVGRLLTHMVRSQFRSGEVLFRKGDRSDALYYVVRGRFSLPEIGIEVGPGAILGEIGMFSTDHRRMCTARCESDSELLSASATDAMRLYYQDPEFATYLTCLITRRLHPDTR